MRIFGGKQKEPENLSLPMAFKATERHPEKKEIVNTKAILLSNQQDQYFLKANPSLTNITTYITIEKGSGKISEIKDEIKEKKFQEYSGFLGIINIQGENFLMMVKEISIVFSPDGKDKIYELTSLDFLPIEKGANNFKKEVQDFITYLEKFTCCGGYYFSYTYPLTLSSQKISNMIVKKMPASDFVDKDFLWNLSLLKPLEQQKISSVWQPQLIQGSVFNWLISSPETMCTLISRRQSRRGGTRFNHRGIDSDGYVANFVESEQVVVSPSQKLLLSFVQIRGSVPLFWSQKGLVAKLVIQGSKELSNTACQSHLDYLKKSYGKVTSVNLMTYNKSDEKMLSTEYKNQVQEGIAKGDFNLLELDFHHEFKGGNFDPIDKYITQNAFSDMTRYRVFMKNIDQKNENEEASVISRQQGIIRTNCLDCLDRTNFFQLRIAHAALHKIMLPTLDIVIKEDDKPFHKNFRYCWGENGDKISRHYAGTNATTSVAAKKGKQGMFGFITGKLTSASRFFKGNLTDSYKQQCYCVLLGEHFKTQQNLQYQEKMYEQLKEAVPKFTKKNQLSIFAVSWSVNSFVPEKGNIKRISLIFKNNIVSNQKNYNFPSQSTTETSHSSETNPDQKAQDSEKQSQKCDIVVVALQELVEIGSINVFKTDEQKYKAAQQNWKDALQECLGGDSIYFLVDSHYMAGITTFIYAKRSLQDHITGLEHDGLGSSYGGKLINKGGVCIRFFFDDTSIAIINCHFPAGQSAVNERLSSLNYVHQQLFQQEGLAAYKRDPVGKSDKIILMGNLNFRVDKKASEAKQAIQQVIDLQKEFKFPQASQHLQTSLYYFDQIKILQDLGNPYAKIVPGLSSAAQKMTMEQVQIIQNYQEKQIGFLPTYKFDVGTNNYDSSWKSRVPSFPDRVLFWDAEGDGLPVEETILRYDSFPEIEFSDHKPIFAIINLPVKIIDEVLRESIIEEILYKSGGGGEEEEHQGLPSDIVDVNFRQESIVEPF